jgi:histidinol dehydrogenase
LVTVVQKETERQIPSQSRRAFIARALKENGWLIQVKSLADGVALTNRLAPEHLEIMTRQARKVSEQILTAGAIFLGPWSPTVLGDYVAGPSHTLPTGGAGASFPGLSVDQFQRRTSLVEYRRSALKNALPPVLKFAEVEGLEAHGRSATIRFPERSPKSQAQRASRSVRRR